MTGARIDLWWFGFDDAADGESRALALVDNSERKRFRQIPDPKRARLFVMRRAARRVILAGYCGAAPEDLAFAEAEAGKPRPVEPRVDIEFSASDCGNAGILAVSPGQPVGADLEFPRRIDIARLAERILSPAERASYAIAAPDQRQVLILRAWTAKEAVVKAAGTGLDTAVFRQITVPLLADPGTWHSVAVGSGAALPGNWLAWTREMRLGKMRTAHISLAAQSEMPVKVQDAAELLARFGLL